MTLLTEGCISSVFEFIRWSAFEFEIFTPSEVLCFKKIVNVPKRADFSIFHFFGILNHVLIFYGKNTLISCFNVKKF